MNTGISCEIGPSGAMASRQLQRLALAACLLAVCFARPLWQLITFACHSEFFSYIPLVPVITVYLIWCDRRRLKVEDLRPCWPGAALGLLAGGAMIAAYWIGRHGGWKLVRQDYLTLMTLAWLCCFWGLCLAMLGAKLSARVAFPLAFLIFAVPMPVLWQDHIDTFFQYTSAAAAEGFCDVAREPVLREGLSLHLSGFSVRVAPECSGIHSTLVLLMTSLLAGYLFLQRFWTRAVLVLFVVPLAILRNGFRVFVIGWLCVHISPKMIDSPIHHHGGPIFFALSLVPFFLLLFFLRKWDSRASEASKPQPES
jgi:exosortase C (VPDSG-CTERM-specific)